MSGKIFVLDDDEVACQLAETTLSKAGYEVMTQSRAIGATAAMKSFSPDLILLDVMMPAVSGENLVGIIKKNVKNSPKIVYYSNLSSSELQDLVDKTAVDGYVCKVDGPSALVKNIRGFLAGA